MVKHAAAQLPAQVKWYRVIAPSKAILFRPGEAVRVKVWIKRGTGEALTWRLVDQGGSRVAESERPVTLSADADTTFEIASDGLPDGFYVARLRVMRGGKMVERGFVPIGVWEGMPPRDETVGEPFFPFGVYDKYMISRDPVIQMTYLHAVCREMRKMGLNTITSGNTLLPPSKEQLDVAHSYGIRVMLRKNWVKDETVFDHPAVIALMYGDEPSVGHLEQYKQAYDSVQTKYPDKKLVTCMIGDGIGLGGKTDPLRIWPVLKPRLRLVRFYPVRKLNYGPLRARISRGNIPINATFRLIDAASETPWWFVMQAFGANITDLRPDPYWRNPTAGELKALIHLGLAYGASGVVSYSLQTHMGDEAKPTPSLVTQDTLAPEDEKYAAYAELARWVAKVKRHLLGSTFGGLEATADRHEIEVVPRQSADGAKLLYVVNRDGDRAMDATITFIGSQIDSVVELSASKSVPVKLVNGRPAVKLALSPGAGHLWQVTMRDGPVPAERVDPGQMLTYGSDRLIPLGEDYTIYRLVQPMPLWWRFKTDEADAGQKRGWHAAGFDDSDWGYLKVGTFWDRQGVSLKGVGWYRCRFTPDERTLVAKPAKLFFQCVDESAWVYLNGELIFAHYPDSIDGWNKSFAIDVSGRLKHGENVLAVRVLNRAAAGGIFGKVALVTPTDQRKDEFIKAW